jgi:hypothetical protein
MVWTRVELDSGLVEGASACDRSEEPWPLRIVSWQVKLVSTRLGMWQAVDEDEEIKHS